MFENVLVGVDGSSSGQDAVALAAGLVQDGGRLTLVHVRHGGVHPLHVIRGGDGEQDRLSSEDFDLAGAGELGEIDRAAATDAGGGGLRNGRCLKSAWSRAC